MLGLTKTLSLFPNLPEKERPIIRFGNTVDMVSLDNFSTLLRLSDGKANISLDGTDLAGIYSRSDHHQLLTYTDADEMT